MDKRRTVIVSLLLVFNMLFLPCFAQASSTTEAKSEIDTQKKCSLTLNYLYDGTAFENVDVKLFKVAMVSSDFQYTLTEPFASVNLTLNGVKSSAEWNVISSTLESYIFADKIDATHNVKTDSFGKAYFEQLGVGLYLAVVDTVSKGDNKYSFESALISLPDLDAEGIWQYDISANCKAGILSPEYEEKEFKILKLWKGDEENIRPKNVEVEIFKNGNLYEKVILSKENNWAFSWKANDDGSKWTVIERNIPKGYAMTVEEKGSSFVVTNTYTEGGENPNDFPKTGETSNLLLYVIILNVSGLLLIILGIVEKRRGNNE